MFCFDFLKTKNEKEKKKSVSGKWCGAVKMNHGALINVPDVTHNSAL